MEGMNAYTNVKLILCSMLDHVLEKNEQKIVNSRVMKFFFIKQQKFFVVQKKIRVFVTIMNEFGQEFYHHFQGNISRNFCRDSYLVTTNPCGLKSFGRKLLIFVRDKMNAEWKFVNSSLFSAQIENPDLGIRDTTAKPRFWVRLVLTVTVASSGTATHLD